MKYEIIEETEFERIYRLVEDDARQYAISEILSRHMQEYLELKCEYAQKLVKIELARRKVRDGETNLS